MEKINIALSAVEDNAAAIRELNKKLTIRTKCRMVSGASVNGRTSFGQVTSDGGVGVIVLTDASSSVTLKFGDKTVYTGKSTLVGVLPEGKGELYLAQATTNTCAMIIGA